MTIKPQILVIDDDSEIRELFRWMLDFSGYRVKLAHDGHDGVHQFRATKPDLVFLDVKMPGLDGFETLREIRKADPSGKCPVLIITGVTENPKVKDMLKLGAVDYVSKPFDINDLQHKIVSILGLSQVA